MAIVYVDPTSVLDSIDYFCKQEYVSPEQIGLFFLFKARQFSNKEYVPYKLTKEQKKIVLRYLYDLCGIFDAKQETGGKYTSLFPFSMKPIIHVNSYYNGGSVFKDVLGRLKDTVDNTLIDKYLRRDDLDDNQYKFAPNYIDYIRDNFLQGRKISLFRFVAWYFRFYGFDVENDWEENRTEENYSSFTRICIKKMIQDLNLTGDELSELFDNSTGIIKYDTTHITGEEIRAKFTYEKTSDKDPTPVITPLKTPIDYMKDEKILTRKEVLSLGAPQGNNISEEELKTLLFDTKQVVLSGPPGTGKSNISSKIRSSFDESFLIQFHPNMTYEQFIGGNTFDKDGNVKPIAGVFLEFCHNAEEGKKYLFIIDEINRGNVAKVFGETIIALDREYSVKLPTPLIAKDGQIIEEFCIPENVYILATMNSADRSIALVDYAIRRRFAFVDFSPNSEIVDYESDYTHLSGIKVGEIMDGINNKLFSVIGDKDILLGQSFFLPKWARDGKSGKIVWTPKVLLRLFNYYLLPMIEEYAYGNRRYLQNIMGDKLITRISNETEFLNEIRIQFLG